MSDKPQTTKPPSDFELMTLIIRARDIPMAIKEWPNGFVVSLDDDIYLDFGNDGKFEGARHETD